MALTLEMAEQVHEKLWAETDVEVEVRESYSGRFMYGKSVVAFTANDASAVTAIAWAFGALGFPIEDVPSRTDSMGYGVVVY